MNIKISCIVITFLALGLCGAEVVEETQIKQTATATNAVPQGFKAYKNLFFGDNAKSVKDKLGEILVGAVAKENYGDLKNAEAFWRMLFETDAEYEPYKCNENPLVRQSDKFQLLKRYFEKLGGGTAEVRMISGKNDVLYINCYLIDVSVDHLGQQMSTAIPSENMGLAVVEVVYMASDREKFVAGFLQTYPSAKQETKRHKVELAPFYQGVFVEYDEVVYSDIDRVKRAVLITNVGKPTVTFAKDSKFTESEKSSIAGKIANAPSDAPPRAVFASKQILDFHMNNFRALITQAFQSEKNKSEKEKEAAVGF